MAAWVGLIMMLATQLHAFLVKFTGHVRMEQSVTIGGYAWVPQTYLPLHWGQHLLPSGSS